MPEAFAQENFVVISSTIPITMRKWRLHLEKNWDTLMKENTRLLVLAGVHGDEDGQLGPNEDKEKEAFVCNSEGQIGVLHKNKSDDIAQKNIVMKVEDVGVHRDRSVLDREKFVSAVKDFNPTMILLAFCFSKVSELNDILRAAGIYTGMTVREEMAQITESRSVYLSDNQKGLIDLVASKKAKNVFLWGSSGTGKTVMLAEAVKIRASQCKQEGKDVRVIISTSSSLSEGAPLWRDLQQMYLKDIPGIMSIRFVKNLAKLSKELNADPSIGHPQAQIQNILAALSQDSSVHTILVADEVWPDTTHYKGRKTGCKLCVEGVDWGSLAPSDGVDLFMALSTLCMGVSGHRHQDFNIVPPRHPEIQPWKLDTPHRNSPAIRQLVNFVLHHSCRSSWYIDPWTDKEAPHLPDGPLPIWIEKAKDVTNVEILRNLSANFVPSDMRVTVLYDDKKPDREAEKWCASKNWQYDGFSTLWGSDNQCVVLLDLGLGITHESVTRARNILVVVTGASQTYETKVFDHIFEHAHPMFDCDNDCRFGGRQLLNKFVMEGGGSIKEITEVPEPKGYRRKGPSIHTERMQNILAKLEKVQNTDTYEA